eukprot:gene11103-3810_t
MFLLDPPLLKLPLAILVLVLNVIFPGIGFIISGFISEPRNVTAIILGVVVLVLFYAVPFFFYIVVGLFNLLVGNNFGSIVLLPIWIAIFFVWLYSVVWSVTGLLNAKKGNSGSLEGQNYTFTGVQENSQQEDVYATEESNPYQGNPYETEYQPSTNQYNEVNGNGYQNL